MKVIERVPAIIESLPCLLFIYVVTKYTAAVVALGLWQSHSAKAVQGSRKSSSLVEGQDHIISSI